jgi:hypothetical protein
MPANDIRQYLDNCRTLHESSAEKPGPMPPVQLSPHEWIALRQDWNTGRDGGYPFGHADGYYRWQNVPIVITRGKVNQ